MTLSPRTQDTTTPDYSTTVSGIVTSAKTALTAETKVIDYMRGLVSEEIEPNHIMPLLLARVADKCDGDTLGNQTETGKTWAYIVESYKQAFKETKQILKSDGRADLKNMKTKWSVTPYPSSDETADKKETAKLKKASEQKAVVDAEVKSQLEKAGLVKPLTLAEIVQAITSMPSERLASLNERDVIACADHLLAAVGIDRSTLTVGKPTPDHLLVNTQSHNHSKTPH